MLVPFALNEENIKKFNIPQHVADWHRVRILKEIDDIRYQAMMIANMDLSGESMLALKKLKLFALFNPIFDANGNITKYDPIVEAFDIPLDWYFGAAIDLLKFLKRNNLDFDANTLTRALRDDALKVITNFQGTKAFFFFLGSTNLEAYKDAVFSCFNFLDYSGNFDFSSEDNTTFWNYKPFLSIGRDCARLNSGSASATKLSSGNVVTDIPISSVNIFNYRYNSDYLGYRPFNAYGTFFTNSVYYFFDPKGETIPEILKLEVVLGYISSSIMHFAPLASTIDVLKNSTISKVEDRNKTIVLKEPYINFKNPSSTTQIISLASTDERSYDETLTKDTDGFYQFYKSQNVVLDNAKTYFLPSDTYKYRDASNQLVYSRNIFSKINFSLGVEIINPSLVTDNYIFTMAIPDFSSQIVGNINPMGKKFYDVNFEHYNFPAYFPRLLLFRLNRVRNGILYSDASNFYQLEFIRYPDSVLDRIDDLINQQESIYALIEDLQTKFLFYEVINNVGGWYYVEMGVKIPFIHPVTQKPISAIRYLFELIFEMVVTWGKVQSEIDKFFEAKKIQNEQAFNLAYQNYLRGQATIQDLFNYEQLQKNLSIINTEYSKAYNEMQMADKTKLYYVALYQAGKISLDQVRPYIDEYSRLQKVWGDLGNQRIGLEMQIQASKSAAVLQFEEKLKTGIFYIENGMEYWRKFTSTEMSLIEKFKADAIKNAEIMQKNEEIKALNKKYQDEVNLPIIFANQQKIAEAELIAKPELKKIVDEQVQKIVAPTISYLISRAEKEGGFPSDSLAKWVEENPYYYIRPDLSQTVEKLLQDITLREQQVATLMISDVVNEIEFTKALQELFDIRK